VLTGVAILSIWIAIETMLPEAKGKHISDGRQIWHKLRDGTQQDAFHAFSYIFAMLNRTVRLRDIPQWLLALLRADPPLPEELARMSDSLEISCALDAGRVEPAHVRTLIETFREKYGTNGWLGACDAYLAAIYEHDPERAEIAMEMGGEDGGTPELTLAAEAAVAAAKGETKFAEAKLAEMDNILRLKSPFLNETFRDIRTAIEAVATLPNVSNCPDPGLAGFEPD
jgi:hypothetical protein